MRKTLFIIFFIISKLIISQEIKVFHEESYDGIIKIYAQNFADSEYSVRLNVAISGMRSSKFLPAIILVRPNSKTLLTTLTKTSSSWSYNYDSSWILGNSNARHKKKTIYTLPFKKGESYLLMQGYNETYSHKNKNALDFKMPEGTEICAMREGEVIEIKSNSNKGCPSKSCVNDGNFILIKHSDGTLAEYFHLKYQGVKVKIGQKIKQGEVIGLSGNTGWSTSSHLHVMVYKNQFNNKQKTYKTLFKIDENNNGFLEKRKLYTAY
jgi:murein DD-endopeptidase MepM/ murein hydrolase activator NlpD